MGQALKRTDFTQKKFKKDSLRNSVRPNAIEGTRPAGRNPWGYARVY
jgi:hypothetical protein